ncbi:MAG TPA: ABC transporter ATP-binding protein [Anaerolineae bacterium]|nr:ABC transporter ATP-binding protein [Anaerolineae bacterium]HIQ06058.1 ABC transporter ATP-binding protein [Anaerolineae bacterium]
MLRDKQKILRSVNLVVKSGEIHALLGLNGCGKTSLAYTIIGCAGYTPTTGRILFDQEDITRAPIHERAQLGLTLAWQEPARFEGLRVRDYLALGMKERDRDRIWAALEAVRLPPAVYLHRTVNQNLSGGERKRIELAAVYAMRPRLAILDEPDSGIDVLTLDDIARLVQRMAAEGTAVLLITHRDEMVEVADRASLMCAGAIVKTGDPAEVRHYFGVRCQPHGDFLGSQPWRLSVDPGNFQKS